MGPSDIEICSNCGRAISRLEQAYIFEGNIVCAECDNTLRSGPLPEPLTVPEPAALPELVTVDEPQPEATSPSKEDEQGKQSQRVDKPVGFIIAGVILCFLGVVLIELGLAGLAVFFLGGFLIGMLMAGGCLTFGLLILVLGIAAIVVAVISVRGLPRERSR
ncbi:MAG TPA: hypothetical protein VMY06_02175 [Sedimentisphaerales bacterium]|nr:hypothetical protein [Sedimentisphaerales bacterium]